MPKCFMYFLLILVLWPIEKFKATSFLIYLFFGDSYEICTTTYSYEPCATFQSICMKMHFEPSGECKWFEIMMLMHIVINIVNLKCEVWSVECGVWNVECGVLLRTRILRIFMYTFDPFSINIYLSVGCNRVYVICWIWIYESRERICSDNFLFTPSYYNATELTRYFTLITQSFILLSSWEYGACAILDYLIVIVCF